MKTVADRIKHLHPCADAMTWAAGYTSAAKAWRECPDGSWMLWLLGMLSGPVGSKSRKKLVLAACKCARLALPHVPAGELRPLAAIEASERYCRGEATIDEVGAAARAARAAWAAARAAGAAGDAEAAGAAGAAWAAEAAGAAVLKTCADIVRDSYPKPPAIRINR